MFDLGWSEMMIIATVVLIIFGPKDLPKVLKTATFWMRKGRALAKEFRNGLDEIVREAELDELKKDLESATRYDLKGEMEKTIDPTGSLVKALDAPDELTKSKAEPAAAGDTEAKPKAKPAAAGDTAAKPKAEPATAGDTEAKPKAEPAAAGDTAAKPKAEPAAGGASRPGRGKANRRPAVENARSR